MKKELNGAGGHLHGNLLLTSLSSRVLDGFGLAFHAGNQNLLLEGLRSFEQWFIIFCRTASIYTKIAKRLRGILKKFSFHPKSNL